MPGRGTSTTSYYLAEAAPARAVARAVAETRAASRITVLALGDVARSAGSRRESGPLVSSPQASTFLEGGGASPHGSEQGFFATVGHGLESGALALGVAVVLGWLLARALRRAGLAWTWALLGLPAGYLAGGLLVGSLADLDRLGDRGREGLAPSRRGRGGRRRERGARAARATAWARCSAPGASCASIDARAWISGGRLTVGRTSRTGRARIPVGEDSGKHTLVVGATGSGKTVSAGVDRGTA